MKLGNYSMTLNKVFLLIAVILFILTGFRVALGGYDLIPFGLAFFAAAGLV